MKFNNFLKQEISFNVLWYIELSWHVQKERETEKEIYEKLCRVNNQIPSQQTQ